MPRLILRRLALMAPVLLGLLVLVFVLTRLVPSDPAAMLAGEQATAAQIAELRARLGLDRPLPVQFWLYVTQVAQGDFGTSLYTHRSVLADLAERIPATIELALATMTLSIGLGVPLGVVAAVHRNGVLDHLIRVVTIAGLAVASFWMALMLQLVFSMWLDVLPLRGRIATGMSQPPIVTGLFTLDYLLAGDLRGVAHAAWHLVLPAVTLALPATATIARFTRSSVIETLQKDFVTWERAIGYPQRVVIWRYVLRNSLSATVTQVGLLFGLFLSGSIVVEAVFGWPGLGDYLYNAILISDYQPVLATTLAIGVVYALVNIAVDLTQALIDPRVAEQG
ncbi:ABC transporter permease [Falsiroseomonas sp.]|uniref:ABC transporter permease n=1 Tax=Falsiroseomonas sp. TaxID=2870721 RepID=UPI0035635A89